MKTLIVVLACIFSLGLAYGYNQTDLVRDVQKLSKNCVTKFGGFLKEDVAFVYQTCYFSNEFASGKSKHTLLINSTSLEFKRYPGFLFTKKNK